MKEIKDCHQCSGIGKIFLRNMKHIKCDMCEGTGKSEGNYLWFIQGLMMQNFRIDKEHLTLREAARKYKIDPSNLSKMERGIIKPDSNYMKLILE